MGNAASFDKIELHLVRVLHVLITERSVSRAALKLNTTQPVVSAQLKRLRELTGDALLVRAGNAMTPTDAALTLVGPAANLLREAEALFSARSRTHAFEPSRCTATFRIAASDYLDPLFLPELVARLKSLAPGARLELHSLSEEFDYRRSLARGEVDLVVGNWLEPPGELHLAKLISDEVVCLVAENHPVRRHPKGFTVERYLQSEHIAPMPMHPGAKGVIDEHLAQQGLQRNVAARSAHFSLIPLMVANSLLVLTTGRLFCSRYTETLPLAVMKCPVTFPPLTYYQLWHDLAHASTAQRWLREQVKEAARALPARSLPRREGVA
jgi:DNA-binding transcriptional LysR family regulator